jgi:G patch domain/KOW motif-containing protein
MSSLGGKLSFGFSKVIKKPNLLKNNSENTPVTKNIQLIDSIEGTELKVQGKNADDDKPKDLVIPLTDEQKSRPIAKLIESRIKQRSKNEEVPETNGKAEQKEETLEQRAAREIMEDLQNKDAENETKILELPLHPDELPLDGATESTIDDYERIPIADFGKAMLRGMGWKEEKKEEGKDDPSKFDIFVRPKGLGLGADKVVKRQKLLVNPAPNETLEIKKKACVKILAGKHKNLYGTVSNERKPY